MEVQCRACDLLKRTDGILIEKKYTTAVLDPNQYWPGRTWVIWKEHIPNELELTKDERAGLMLETLSVAEALYKAYGCERVNYVMTMNKDKHVHFHLIPRTKEGPQGALTRLDELAKLASPDDYAQIRRRIKRFL